MNRLWAFGDSISAGIPGDVNNNPEWYPHPYLIALDKHHLITNLAADGAQAADQYMAFGTTTPATGDRICVMLGTNDERTYGVNQLKLNNFATILAAECYFITQQTSKAQSWGASGTWNSTSGQTIGLYSTTVGNSLTTTFNGPTLTFGYLIDDAVGGSFSVTVDGVNVGTYNTQSLAPIMTTLGKNSGPALGRIIGFSPGPHTVVFQQTAAGTVYLDWVGIGPNGAKLLLSTIPRMTSAAYTAFGGSDANVASYNQAIRSLVTQMQEDGLSALLVDSSSSVNPLLDLGADGLHPNQQGRVNIATTFLNMMN